MGEAPVTSGGAARPSSWIGRHRVGVVAVAAVLALSMSGCGGDDDSDDGDDGATTSETTASTTTDGGGSEEGTTGSSDTTDPAEGTTAGGGPTTAIDRPANDTCVDVPEAPDGRYLVADAGVAVVQREGDRLVVGEVTPNEGWRSDVEIDDDGDVDVDFQRGNEEVWLEVEITGGEVRAMICADDD